MYGRVCLGAGESGNQTGRGCGATPPLPAPYHLAQQFHKTQRPDPDDSWQGGQNKWL